MPTSNWSRTDNFFKNAANKSYIGAKGIFNALDTKLHGGIADPDILAFYNSFNPLNTTFNTNYAIWDGLRSTGIGKTLGVVQLLDLLSSTKIKAWDIAIQGIYINNTPEYAHLLPHHRTPFQISTVEKRVAALVNLIAAIGTDASLATVKTSVSAFLLQLQTAIGAQATQITGIDTAIVNMETASNAASDEAFGIFGGFLTKFKATPKLIDIYMPVSFLQNIMQVSFSMTLKFMKVKKVFKRKLDPAKQKIRGTNVGMFAVKGYFTNGLTDQLAAGAAFITMPANTTEDYDLVAAGYTDTNRHFYVVNEGVIDASVEVAIMVEN